GIKYSIEECATAVRNRNRWKNRIAMWLRNFTKQCERPCRDNASFRCIERRPLNWELRGGFCIINAQRKGVRKAGWQPNGRIEGDKRDGIVRLIDERGPTV